MYVYYENFMFGFKVEKKSFESKKLNYLLYIISIFIVINLGRKLW